MYFYYGFLEQKSDISTAGSSPKKINLSRILDFLKLFKNSKLLSLLTPQKKDNLILSSQRYVDGNEIYTKEIKKYATRQAKNNRVADQKMTEKK